MDRAVTLLPQPLSPTTPTDCPGSTSNEMPSTARTVPSSSSKRTRRSRTAITGCTVLQLKCVCSGMGIGRVTQSIPHEVEREYGERSGKRRPKQPWVERNTLDALGRAQQHAE